MLLNPLTNLQLRYSPVKKHRNMPGVDRVYSATPHTARTRLTEPLEYTGLLDSYKHRDLTPVIGREYQGLQIVDLLKAENSRDLIRDVAVTS